MQNIIKSENSSKKCNDIIALTSIVDRLPFPAYKKGFFIRSSILVPLLGLALGPFCFFNAQAAAISVSSDSTDPADKHIYIGQYDLTTNLWGIRGAGSNWYADIFTHSISHVDGAGYKWSGFAGNQTNVKAYVSLRYGASNKQNIASVTGLPYLFENNDKNVDVLWSFESSGEDGTGNIVGKYNHTLDVFFNATNSTKVSEIRGEVMIITDSSQDAQMAGWGVKDIQPFIISGEIWDVWQATQTSHGHSWHVTQFRKRLNSRYFNHNLKDFFFAAAARRPDIFMRHYYVMMVEAGTEIKNGSGRVYYTKYRVSITRNRRHVPASNRPDLSH
ncbi:glycoside hydrolase family 12 protein [Hafnia psychrotolerans]|nr:hypothetical protein [Hafnia psychrotolerans]